jgi:hypothetical protein
MRVLLRFTVPAAAVAFAALITQAGADDPAPLLKPVTPPADRVRVRIPVEEKGGGTAMQFKAQVPKAKKGEVAEVTVAIETMPGPSCVSAKKWRSLGYEVPANKTVVLPELLIPGTQLAPKPSKGRDVEAKLTDIRLEVVEPPSESDKVRGCDFYLCMNDLTRNAYRAFEPRVYFADKFLELSAPAAGVKRPGTGDDTPPEPAVNPDPTLVVVAGPTVNRGGPVFAYAAVNGLTQYKTPDGKNEPVNVGVSSTTDWPSGVMMTMGAARGIGIELERGKDVVGDGTGYEAMVAKGTIKELRLGFVTGPGKAAKDLVVKDVTVWVDKNNSGHFLWLGPRFLEEHFKDAVYAFGPDGWRLHGRMKPDLLQDTKTRPKKP